MNSITFAVVEPSAPRKTALTAKSPSAAVEATVPWMAKVTPSARM
jgi:hypothetical protein